jgi:hypothetical protein
VRQGFLRIHRGSLALKMGALRLGNGPC